MTTAAIVAVARHLANVQLDDRKEIKLRVEKSRKIIDDKVATGASVYGLSTGFGGSGAHFFLFLARLFELENFLADTRTDKPLKLGDALLQHQHIGILPTTETPPDVLPLQDPAQTTTMPESWVR